MRDGLLATDRLERHRAFPGRRNAVCRDLLESHFYREPGCRNDNSFILTKNLPTPTDDCSLQMKHPDFFAYGYSSIEVRPDNLVSYTGYLTSLTDKDFLEFAVKGPTRTWSVPVP